MFRCGRFAFDLDRPLVMGIINVTADSFSDGGRYLDAERAIEQGLRLMQAGADILDIGGESTRPGAEPVSLDAELARILPALAGLRDCGAALSVDTMKPEVMRAALDAGADLINDVNAFRAPGAWDAVVDSDCGLCLMHMQGEPRTMQADPQYQDVVAEVGGFLVDRLAEAAAHGIAQDRLLIDPGFGFGKTLAHNMALFHALPGYARLAPVLVGVSRKSMLGTLTGRPVQARMPASIVAAVLAARGGAAVLRVHDVAETVDALKIWQALGEQQ
jgi:dihydropteroate synthase